MGNASKTNNETRYSPEIDGLRGIAVLIVVFYHAVPNWVPGVFIGVDVFFVISGYLITSMLMSELRSGSIDLLAFYQRRIRRLFPALIVVLSSCLVAGYFLLLPKDFTELGQSVFATSLFLSNFYFLREVGYFDQAGEAQALLHTWSLGVEEQFYLALPVLLLLVRRPSLVKPLLLLVGLASPLLFLWLQQEHAKLSFYLPVTRFWEFAVGGLLGFAAGRSSTAVVRRFCTGMGLTLIVLVAVSGRSTFGEAGCILMGCLAAGLVIYGVKESTNIVLADARLVGIGLVSFSFLYTSGIGR